MTNDELNQSQHDDGTTDDESGASPEQTNEDTPIGDDQGDTPEGDASVTSSDSSNESDSTSDESETEVGTTLDAEGILDATTESDETLESDGTDADGDTTQGSWIPPALATQPVAPAAVHDALPELREWAVANGVLWDPYVADILNAVETRSDLTLWATLDPLQLLPHPAPRKGSQLRRIARILYFIRNVAVFVPVAVTWFGIREATTAFSAYADAADKAGNGEQVNFLRFWQNGGDGMLDSAWRIHHIALIDAILIALIVLFTLVAGVLEARSNRLAALQDAQIETDRTRVALSIRKTLHGSRQATPESITQSLAESLADLLGGARLMNSAALRIERTSVGLESIGPRFDQLNQRLDQASTTLGGELLRSVETLRSSVVTLGQTVNGDLSQVLNQVLVGLDEIRLQLGKTSASVEFGTKKLRDDLDAVHQQLGGMMRGGRP